MAFSQDDLATRAYGADYSATISAEYPTTRTLTLTPKAGKETTYAKIEVDVCAASELRMTNLVQGNWTRSIRKTWKVNENLSDELFSQRSLGQ